MLNNKFAHYSLQRTDVCVVQMVHGQPSEECQDETPWCHTKHPILLRQCPQRGKWSRILKHTI